MSLKTDKVTLPGSLPKGLNPLPRFRRQTGFQVFRTGPGFPSHAAVDLGACTLTLPYMMQDRYEHGTKETVLDTVVLENGYLKAVFVPALGGKMWSLYDKVNNRDLLMSNPVIRPCNLAIRNAWMSGGIELNFGSLGHTYFTCDDVFAAKMDDGTGNEFLRMYEYERAKECIWQADFILPENSPVLFSHVKLFNPNNENVTTYWWTNAAIPDDGKTRVLSSTRKVISVGDEGLCWDELPVLSVMPGDLSYPSNASRSFDYFFQPNEGDKTAWEAAVDSQGFAFFDRATSPLLYHKLFCWGSHRGGDRWQEFLSDKDRGRYIELQAGIARSQLHDRPFPGRSEIEWTQCFGGTALDPHKVHNVSLEEADRHMEKAVDGIITETDLISFDSEFRRIASISPREDDIIHNGSGWGALEIELEKLSGEPRFPSSVLFPAHTIGKLQAPWIELLRSGKLPEQDPDMIPDSWMTSGRWLSVLDKSLEIKDSENWFSQLNRGNMLFERWDCNHTVPEAINWPDSERKKYELAAEAAWIRSDSLRPNVWARRNLAVLETLRKNQEAAEKYYDSVFTLPASRYDFSFAAEYISWLNDHGKYEKAFSLYESMPENIKSVDRVILCAAVSALRIDRLDFVTPVFEAEHPTIREGEETLTVLWFEYHARILGAKRGLPLTPENIRALTYEAEEAFPPPHSIDFRMSVDRAHRYRETK